MKQVNVPGIESCKISNTGQDRVKLTVRNKVMYEASVSAVTYDLE